MKYITKYYGYITCHYTAGVSLMGASRRRGHTIAGDRDLHVPAAGAAGQQGTVPSCVVGRNYHDGMPVPGPA